MIPKKRMAPKLFCLRAIFFFRGFFHSPCLFCSSDRHCLFLDMPLNRKKPVSVRLHLERRCFAVDIRDGEGDLLPRVGAVRFEGDVLIIGTAAVAHFHIRGKAQRRSLGIAAGWKFPYGHI